MFNLFHSKCVCFFFCNFNVFFRGVGHDKEGSQPEKKKINEKLEKENILRSGDE